MTKLEYQTITILLKEKERYQEVLRGFKERTLHYVISKHCDGEQITQYLLNIRDEEVFIKYFEKLLKDTNEELKRLGYDD